MRIVHMGQVVFPTDVSNNTKSQRYTDITDRVYGIMNNNSRFAFKIDIAFFESIWLFWFIRVWLVRLIHWKK